MAEFVQVELTDGVGELVLNRPARRNALIGPLVTELHAGLNELDRSGTCGAIIIRGAEGYFCAGLDLKAFSEDPAPAWRATFQDDWASLHSAIYSCSKPVLGALEGFAIAGGSALAFACDFLVAGRGAFLHVAEVERGLAAPINVAWLSIRFTQALALEMAVLGERHYGEDLYRLGIATRVEDDDRVLEVTRALARRLAGFDAGAVQGLKRALRRSTSTENFDQVLARVRQSP
ncbi:MAG: enoyl-CoA hydratase/isomerase family protein [Proteobacteria bacterium]|jgi:enoyl-CoA hydratase/carnithine racemase|nr:enoyl-CoA hydratase/isomerase family protein [Pseudomonadota bacterium]